MVYALALARAAGQYLGRAVTYYYYSISISIIVVLRISISGHFRAYLMRGCLCQLIPKVNITAPPVRINP